MCHGSNPRASLTWGSEYIRTHIVPNNEKNQALAAIHSQTLPAKNTLKYYYEFYLFTIASLNHLHEYLHYVLEEINTLSICPPEGHRNFQQSRYIPQRGRFNPHLTNTFILSNYTRYRIQSTPTHHNRVVTLQTIFWWTTLDRRGRVVSSY